MRTKPGGKCVLTGSAGHLSRRKVHLFLSSPGIGVSVCSRLRSAGRATGGRTVVKRIKRKTFIVTEDRATNEKHENQRFCSPTSANLCVDIVLGPRKAVRSDLLVAATTTITICETITRLYKVRLSVG